MAERLTPGVYIEEKSGGVRPIQGAVTSTAGFVGEAERGIPGRATFLGASGDYARMFGAHRRGSAGHLAAAVQSFFGAGGRRAYVVRVLPGDATAGASVDLLARDADAWGVRRPVLRLRAKGTGAWADGLRVHVEPSTAFTGVAFRIRVETAENGRTRTLETFDNVRMDPGHEDYVGTVLEGSQYVVVDDLYDLALDTEPRTLPAVPETVAALVTREPEADGDRFAVPRGARLQLRWTDALSGRSSGDLARAVVFDDDDTPGTADGDDVLMTTGELTDWLRGQLGEDFRITGPGLPARLTTSDGPWDTSGGDTAVFEVDGQPVNLVLEPVTPAQYAFAGAPFALDAGDVIDLRVGADAQSYTLAAADVTAGAATAEELATVLNREFTGIRAFVANGELRLRTDATGPAASMDLGGSAAAALQNPGATQGAGNIADPAAVTAAELAAAINAIPGLAVRASVQGRAAHLAQIAAGTPITLEWISDPGPDAIVPQAGRGPVQGPVSGGPVRIEPAVAAAALLVAELPGDVLDLSATNAVTVTAVSGPITRTYTADLTALPNRAAVSPAVLAERIDEAIAADAAGQPLGVTATVAGRRLVLTAPAREDGITLALAATGTAPWSNPVALAGAAGALVDDQRAVELTVGEELRPGVARALPRLFATVRAAGLRPNDPANPALRPALTGDQAVRLLGGTDGTGTPGLSEYTAALSAFDTADLGMLAAPGKTDGGYVSALSAYCDQRDVFYVADGIGSVERDFELTADDVRQYVESLPARSRNTGMFYPWIQMPDPVGIGRDPRRFVPPSGHMCGVFARTDATRGVWKAPAGVEAVVSGAIGLQHDLRDTDQDMLNPIGMNCIRQFPGAGIVTWGSRTLGSVADPEWRYVPVRRTALFLKASLRRGLQWAVFEPNDEDLWAQIRLNVTAFMLGLFRQGAFQGATPDEAFLVQCDRDTNPQELIDQGIVTTRVAFAPLKPAEFVVVELSQKALVSV
jgi:phage tail sheath protein FI